jgi:hypothetical protein
MDMKTDALPLVPLSKQQERMMHPSGQPTARSKIAMWIGRVLSGVVILFLLFDSGIKLIPLDIVLTASAELGLPAEPSFARMLGGLLLASTLLYAYPRTSVFGAILLTGYLGGAIATHLRIGDPLFSHTLFGVYLGLMIWGGLYLRDMRVRRLIPLLGD